MCNGHMTNLCFFKVITLSIDAYVTGWYVFYCKQSNLIFYIASSLVDMSISLKYGTTRTFSALFRIILEMLAVKGIILLLSSHNHRRAV
jgi:hypothetical protein